LDTGEHVLGHKRIEASKTMSVAAGTRPKSDESERFEPYWLMSSTMNHREANALSQKILGKIVAHETARTQLPFAARSVLTTRPSLGLMSCFHPALQWSPQREDAQGDTPGERRLMLLRPADGRVIVRHRDGQTRVKAREAIVTEIGAETSFAFVQVGRIDLIEIDPSYTAWFDGAVEERLMQPIPRSNRGLQVLAHYGALLLRGLLPLTSAELRSLAVSHIHDLIGVMLQDRSAPTPVLAVDRRAGRLAAIKADIETRLEHRDLGIDVIAGLNGVSPRSVQKLFETESQTFSEYVLQRRLERAWQRLTSTEESDDFTISGVAFDVGFGDLSYFNRSFRKRFGRSPSQVRARPADSKSTLP